MATPPLDTLLRHIRKLAAGRALPGQTDRQLLEDFAARRDEGAFTALVARHGPMVLHVCRRVLNQQSYRCANELDQTLSKENRKQAANHA
jgi:hypothetical protein